MVDYETFQKEWDEAVGEDDAREFEQWKRCSEMLRWLRLRRISSGYTEKEIADTLGWTEEQVLTFEMSELQDIHFRDLLPYLEAIGVGIGIRLIEKNLPIAEHIDFHASKVHDLFKEFIEMIGNDKEMTERALAVIYAYNQLVTNRTVELVALFENQSAVKEALEKILPPEFKPSQNIREDDIGILDYKASFVPDEVVLNSPSG